MISSIYDVLAVLGLGIVSGIVGSMFGIGSGVVVVPFLHSFFALPPVAVVATSAAQIPLMAAAGVQRYAKHKKIAFKKAFIILAAALPSAQATAYLLDLASSSPWWQRPAYKDLPLLDTVVIISYILLFTSIGFYNVVQGRRVARKGHSDEGAVQVNYLDRTGIALASGVLVGVISALLGVGGGFLLVPLFIYFGKMEQVQAVATSLFIVFVTTLFTAGTYLLHNQVLLDGALLIGGGGFLGSLIGVRWSLRLAPSQRLQLLGTLQLVMVIFYIAVKA